MEIKAVSSLEKVCDIKIDRLREVENIIALPGETVSFQIVAVTDKTSACVKAEVESSLGGAVRLYDVKPVIVDVAKYDAADDDYIMSGIGSVPDVLVPIEKQNGIAAEHDRLINLWCEVALPRDTAAGEYSITVKISADVCDTVHSLSKTVGLTVLAQTLPQQSLIYTQWFHADCIATAHKVPIYSEEHWKLIESYMRTAAELGVNTILTPVITPPLDIEQGRRRPCTQLVGIEKNGDKYGFDFSLLKRWTELAEDCGMKYFEISHLFSQWGLEYSPNILVTENGEDKYLFGWHVSANDPSYASFLRQLLPALIEFLKEQGIKERCIFHLSDEPSEKHIEAYRYAYDLVIPLLDGAPHMDAISNIVFYEKGLIDMPVCASDRIEPFIESGVENLWVYYCCSQGRDVGNRFMAMPSYRNRILGLQMYKYNIKGFLHWGYNFYYSRHSRYEINPFLTTSADGAFPSGDPFSVYPTEGGALKSLRAVVFKEALCDFELCRLLERHIGHDGVVRLIEEEAGMEITFSEYPRNTEFIPAVTQKMKKLLREYK